MPYIKIIISTVVINIYLCGISFADLHNKELQKNPFIKPNLLPAISNGANNEGEQQNAQSEIQLQATLFSEDESLVKVDDVIIFVGEKIKGYELISVGEGVATFSKNGQEITLSVSELHQKLKK